MHFLPPCYQDALAQAGLTTLDGGIPVPTWSEDAALQTMDRLGIETAMLSVSSPSVRFVDGEAERALARDVNQVAADLIRRRPDRFGGFATLPLGSVEDALDELAFALDELGLDGAILETNIRGRYLGDPTLAPLFAELDRRAAVLFLHPTSPACFESVALGRPAPLIEYPFDTTRTVVDLLFSGTLKRCPNLKIIVPHGGGTIPPLTPRIASFAGKPYLSPRPDGPEEALQLLADLYYDTVQSGRPGQFEALRAMTRMDRILFGTDWPFGVVEAIEANRDALFANRMTDEERTAVARGNAETLFPRLQSRAFAGTAAGCACGAPHEGATGGVDPT